MKRGERAKIVKQTLVVELKSRKVTTIATTRGAIASKRKARTKTLGLPLSHMHKKNHPHPLRHFHPPPRHLILLSSSAIKIIFSGLMKDTVGMNFSAR